MPKIEQRDIRFKAVGGAQLADNLDLSTKSLTLPTGVVLANLGYDPLRPSNNLSELTNATSARNNLGLGPLAVRNNLSEVFSGALNGTYAANTWHDIWRVSSTGAFWFIVYVSTYLTGDSYSELYSGYFSCGSTYTNSNASESLYSVRGGHAPNTSVVNFRMLRSFASDPGLVFQLATNQTWNNLNNTEGRAVNYGIFRIV
jgi:hypothetical protein